jgi:hypothetical protein
MEAVSEARAVYVGERATLDQVAAAMETWQKQTGDGTEYAVEAVGDGYLGMGFVVDVYAANDAEQLAARNRIAAGIRPLLSRIPVATDSELDEQVLAATNRKS